MSGTLPLGHTALSIYSNERINNLYPDLEDSLLNNDSKQEIDPIKDAEINKIATEKFKEHLENAANKDPLVTQAAIENLKRNQEKAAIEFQPNPKPLKQPIRLDTGLSNPSDKSYKPTSGPLSGIVMNEQNRAKLNEFLTSPRKSCLEILAKVFDQPFDKQTRFLTSLKDVRNRILILNWIDCASEVFPKEHDQIKKVIDYFCEDPNRFLKCRDYLYISHEIAYGWRRILTIISLSQSQDSKIEQAL